MSFENERPTNCAWKPFDDTGIRTDSFSSVVISSTQSEKFEIWYKKSPGMVKAAMKHYESIESLKAVFSFKTETLAMELYSLYYILELKHNEYIFLERMAVLNGKTALQFSMMTTLSMTRIVQP